MKKAGCFVFFVLFIILFACNTEKKDDNEKISSKYLISESYKPSFFENDLRVKRIKEIAPELQLLIEKHLATKNIPGIAYGIVVDNELVIASSAGLQNIEKQLPVTSKSCFRIASMTKSFVAMAILKLRDEGRISLEDPVEKYIPEMAGIEYLTSDAPLVTVKNLLTMTAGFPEDNPWADRQLDESDQMLTDLIADGIAFSNVPSFSYEYSNTGFAILGKIISQVSGVPYQQYISEKILLPLGMKNTYWEIDSVSTNHIVSGYRWEDGQWKPEPMLHDGSFGAIGGLITSIEDFSKYVSFHLSAWPPRSEPDTGVIKRSSLREMQTPVFTRLYANAKDWNGNFCAHTSGYGYGLRINEFCNGLKDVGHGGALPGFGSNYTFFPEYGVGLMAFCNLTYTSPWPLGEIYQLLFEENSLNPRELPASVILSERKAQLAQLIQNWDSEIETNLFAENFYLDKSRDARLAEVKEMLDKAGTIKSVEDFEPDNQLRGSFKLLTENGVIDVFFTLSPEKNPKVQQLDMIFEANKKQGL